MAQKVGEMQAKLLKLEAMGDRVSGLAGVKPDDLKPLLRPAAQAASGAANAGAGGPFIPALGSAECNRSSSLNAHVGLLDERTDQTHRPVHADRVAPARRAAGAIDGAESAPIDGPVGSGFGFRSDPFTGRAALHTGLDFPADVGTADPRCGRWRRGATAKCIRNTATWSKSTMAMAWSRATRTPRRCWSRPGTWSSAASRWPRSAPAAVRPARTCTSRCWFEGVPQNPVRVPGWRARGEPRGRGQQPARSAERRGKIERFVRLTPRWGAPSAPAALAVRLADGADPPHLAWARHAPRYKPDAACCPSS